MEDNPSIRLNKVLRELNISLDRAVEFLNFRGIEIDARPTTKITTKVYKLLSNEFETDKSKKVESHEVSEEKRKEKETLRIIQEKKEQDRLDQISKREELRTNRVSLEKPKTLGKINLNELNSPRLKEVDEQSSDISNDSTTKTQTVTSTKSDVQINLDEKGPIQNKIEDEEKETLQTNYQKLSGPKATGEKINLKEVTEKEKTVEDARKRKRKRINKDLKNPKLSDISKRKTNRPTPLKKEEPSEEEVQKQIRETLEKLQGKSSKSKGAKYRRDKRTQHKQKSEEELAQMEAESNVLKVTEFITVGEIATMMNVSTTEIISTCMTLGIMVTMNQRLDAETLSIVSEEFGYELSFEKTELEENIDLEDDINENLVSRAPIVTVMGHVDHGKTSLLDFIRKENVIAGESGGITQHIGAYGVTLENGEKITFLDTPGHEAFTAMRARGAQVTDIAIIVVAADDNIMPQTKEAISHAQAANVPIVFAINKIDKQDANPDKIKEALAGMNLMVEDWGGKIQSQDISAINGTGVNELLEKVLLEAELLELKANPDRKAKGTVVEAFLDKGRGYVSTVLVQNGTLCMGDYILAGKQSGKVKAIFNE